MDFDQWSVVNFMIDELGSDLNEYSRYKKSCNCI